MVASSASPPSSFRFEGRSVVASVSVGACTWSGVVAGEAGVLRVVVVGRDTNR